MPDNSKEIEVISQYFATKRQILTIEKKALEKLSSAQDNPLLQKCSFCGRSENNELFLELFLVRGEDKASICPDCAQQITAMLNRPINE